MAHRLEEEVIIPIGGSKRPFSKAGASEGPEVHTALRLGRSPL